MEFRDLKRQYQVLKPQMDAAMLEVAENCNFISGKQVTELEQQLAEYVGVKHCVTCGNGTDALTLVMMAWDIKAGDAVFVPTFTFFASAEVVAFEGATPVFVDVDERTFNVDSVKLEEAIEQVKKEGKLNPRAVIAVTCLDSRQIIPRLKKSARSMVCFFWKTVHRDLVERSVTVQRAALAMRQQHPSSRQNLWDAMVMAVQYLPTTMRWHIICAQSVYMERVLRTNMTTSALV